MRAAHCSAKGCTVLKIQSVGPIYVPKPLLALLHVYGSDLITIGCIGGPFISVQGYESALYMAVGRGASRCRCYFVRPLCASDGSVYLPCAALAVYIETELCIDRAAPGRSPVNGSCTRSPNTNAI